MLDCLSFMLLNHSIIELVFFHWFTFKVSLSCVLMLSSMFLLIFPISLFVGLMSLHVNLVRKSILWSFMVMNDCVFARVSTQSSIPSLSVIP